MKLFEDKERTNFDRAKSFENTYKYIDQNQQPEIVKIRESLNDWFANYPEQYHEDLINSFKNRFYDAFYELFIHELFFQQGYILQPHPAIEETNRKPDFLAVKGNESVYVEATTVSYLSDQEIKRDNFRTRFVDELNKMDIPDFWLALETLEFKSNLSPRVSKIRGSLEKMMTEFKTTPLSKPFIKNYLRYEDNLLKIEISILPKSESSKKIKSDRAIGIEYLSTTITDASSDSDKIFRSFKDKAHRYGTLDKPYIVCLNLDLRFNIKYDVDWAFYKPNCFYSQIPKFTKVSAVLLTDISLGKNLDFVKHRLILNRHSTHPLNANSFQLSYEIDKKEIEKKNISELI